jgi:hypothetical protein
MLHTEGFEACWHTYHLSAELAEYQRKKKHWGRANMTFPEATLHLYEAF